jgi:hypothetical protein
MSNTRHRRDIFISEATAHKLKKRHGVNEPEVVQCFQNLEGKFAYDTREHHQSNPPTLWFIAETKTGRRLKVVFIRYSKTEYVVKSAYEPNSEEEALYRNYAEQG